MSIHSLISRRVADAALAACAALSLVVVAWRPIERLEARAVEETSLPSARIETGRTVEMGYTVRFDGVGAEGVDRIWRGAMVGAPRAEITLRVAHREAE